MKTMIIVSEKNINEHVGEYYDDIFEVPHQPTVDMIQDYATEVRNRIRDLWKAEQADPTDGEDSLVAVYLHAASPFNAMLIDYQIVMGKEEGIRVELPYLDSAKTQTTDPEALALIEKLEERIKGNTNAQV